MEDPQGQCGDDLKLNALFPFFSHSLHHRHHSMKTTGKQVFIHQFTANLNALTEVIDVRRHKQAGAISGLPQDTVTECGSAAFSVRAGNVYKAQILLRIAQSRHQPSHTT